ncbi:MAG: lysophospholipid acyltransferase family protein [candidate division NC10 bacterium]|nr:lysophospholipid acyltransferase family protein [candidate division NC10 bacterium]
MVDLGCGTGTFLLRVLHLTLRLYHQFQDEGVTRGLLGDGGQVIFCFWHGRLLMMPFASSIRDAAIMISRHRDGDFVSRFAERMGFQSIRGSATRGSVAAMKSMINAHRKGLHLVITPDGPRGPQHQVKSGVVELAKLTGSPIQPVTFGAFPRKVLDSWDEFVIPLPFATCIFIWGKPLWVPADASKDKMVEFQGILQQRMVDITFLADELSRDLSRKRRWGRKEIEAELLAQGLRKASE